MATRRGGWQSRLPLGTFLGVAGIAMVLFGDAMLVRYRELAASLAEALLAGHRGLFGG